MHSCGVTYANQRSIIVFTSLETFLAFQLVRIYTWHSAVLDILLLGLLHVMVAMGVFRAFSGLLGFWAALVRDTKKMRWYFCLSILNLATGLIILVPLMLLECDCSDYYQCAAVFSFMPRAAKLINPFPPPVGIPLLPRELRKAAALAYAKKKAAEDGASDSTTAMDDTCSDADDPDTMEVTLDDSADDVIEDPMDSFDVTPPGIRWRSFNSTCWQLSPELDWSETANEYQHGTPSYLQVYELSGALRRYIQGCLSSARCALVQADFNSNIQGGVELDACLHFFPVVPIVAADDAPRGYMYFQKLASVTIEKASDRDRLLVEPARPALNDILREATRQEGVQLLKEGFSRVCRCVLGEACSLYWNGTAASNWCRVDPSVLTFCAREGIDIFRHHGSWWSEELCRRRSCRCSGLGRPPRPESHVRKKEGLLWDNQLNFGAECSAWRQEDEQPWCFVGLDSTCVDARHTTHVSSPADQWESTFACVGETQLHYFSANVHKCQLPRYIIIRCGIALWLISCFMLGVVFVFIANQCGDHFKSVEQYAVDIQSDEESKDDFDVDHEEAVNVKHAERANPMLGVLNNERFAAAMRLNQMADDPGRRGATESFHRSSDGVASEER